MQNHDEHTIKKFTQILFDKARQLTQNDYDSSCELVQEVWCKVLTHENLEQEKMNAPYLTQVLKNHFYDKQKLNGKVEEAMPEYAEVQDDTQTEERLVQYLDSNGTGHQVEQVWEYLEQHKDGWILRELVNKNSGLKTLSQYKGMNYENLRKKRFRLLKELKVKLRGGVTTQTLLCDRIQKVFCPIFGRISLYIYKPKKIRTMKHLSLIFVFLPFLFFGCSDNNEMSSQPKNANSNIQKSESGSGSENDFFQKNISHFDTRVRSLNAQEYVKEVYFVNFSDTEWGKTFIGIDSTRFMDNGRGHDEVAGDGIFTSIDKYQHDNEVPYDAENPTRSVQEKAIVNEEFEHHGDLEDFSDDYMMRSKPSGGVSITCDVEFGTCGCYLDEWGACDCCCWTPSNCEVTIGIGFG